MFNPYPQLSYLSARRLAKARGPQGSFRRGVQLFEI